MSETYVCDICDSRIDSGYTVSYAATLDDGPLGIHFGRATTNTVNICPECWPESPKEAGGLLHRLSELLP